MAVEITDPHLTKIREKNRSFPLVIEHHICTAHVTRVFGTPHELEVWKVKHRGLTPHVLTPDQLLVFTPSLEKKQWVLLILGGGKVEEYVISGEEVLELQGNMKAVKLMSSHEREIGPSRIHFGAEEYVGPHMQGR